MDGITRLAEGVAVLAFLAIWAMGVIRLFPISLHHTAGGRHYLRRSSAAYVYSMPSWLPVWEVIPHVLYVPTGEPAFRLPQHSFRAGRRGRAAAFF